MAPKQTWDIYNKNPVLMGGQYSLTSHQSQLLAHFPKTGCICAWRIIQRIWWHCGRGSTRTWMKAGRHTSYWRRSGKKLARRLLYPVWQFLLPLDVIPPIYGHKNTSLLLKTGHFGWSIWLHMFSKATSTGRSIINIVWSGMQFWSEQYSTLSQSKIWSSLKLILSHMSRSMKHEHSYLGMVAYAHNSLQIEFITSIKLINFLHVHSQFMHYSIFHLISGIMALHATTGPLIWSNGVVCSFQQLSLIRSHIPA